MIDREHILIWLFPQITRLVDGMENIVILTTPSPDQFGNPEVSVALLYKFLDFRVSLIFEKDVVI